MKIIVISNYSVIREGLAAVISKNEDITIQFIGETIKEAIFLIKSKMADVILLDIHKNNEDELNIINGLKSSEVDTKWIVLDFYGDKELFVKAIKCGVQGYILGTSNNDEIMYTIDQVYKGKKYYDSYFVGFIINENNDFPIKLELLTGREREVLFEITKGLSNRNIAEKFLISENTVKKHVNHIFEKLNIRDRTEAAAYVNRYGMVSK